jgi:hypothetical protein
LQAIVLESSSEIAAAKKFQVKNAEEEAKLHEQLPLTGENLDKVLAKAPELICDAIRVCEDCLLRINDGAMYRIRHANPALAGDPAESNQRSGQGSKSKRSVQQDSLTLLDANAESYHTLLSLGIARQKVTRLSRSEWDALADRLYHANNPLLGFLEAIKEREASSPPRPLKLTPTPKKSSSAARRPKIGRTASPSVVQGSGKDVPVSSSYSSAQSGQRNALGAGGVDSASKNLFSSEEDKQRLMRIIQRDRMRKASNAGGTKKWSGLSQGGT